MGRIRDFLAKRLEAGALTIGQLRVEPGYVLTHADDMGRSDLKVDTDPYEAVAIARYDEGGKYRPLKTAPNLARGWRLELSSVDEVLLALDFLYPAAVGTVVAEEAGELRRVSLRETLGRQSGMYAVTRKLSDEQAESLREGFCRAGCLRRILWGMAPGEDAVRGGAVAGDAPEIPLLCPEACNLFVAEARRVVKGEGAVYPNSADHGA